MDTEVCGGIIHTVEKPLKPSIKKYFFSVNLHKTVNFDIGKIIIEKCFLFEHTQYLFVFSFFSVFLHLENNEFSKFRKLIEIAEMEEEIEEEFSGSENEDEPLLSSELITLFAPTNSAFNKLTTEQEERLTGPGILSYLRFFLVLPVDRFSALCNLTIFQMLTKIWQLKRFDIILFVECFAVLEFQEEILFLTNLPE